MQHMEKETDRLFKERSDAVRRAELAEQVLKDEKQRREFLDGQAIAQSEKIKQREFEIAKLEELVTASHRQENVARDAAEREAIQRESLERNLESQREEAKRERFLQSERLDRIGKEIEDRTKQLADAENRLQGITAQMTSELGRHQQAIANANDILAAEEKRHEETRNVRHELQQRATALEESLAEAKNQLSLEEHRDWGEIFRGILHPSWLGIMLSVLAVLLSIISVWTAIAITEISSRQQFEALAVSDISRLREDLVHNIPKTEGAPAVDSPEMIRLRSLEVALDDVRRLMLVGTNHSDGNLLSITQRSRRGSIQDDSTAKSQSSSSAALGWSQWFPFCLHCSSEFLLFLVVIACGSVGSIVAAMRDGKGDLLKPRNFAKNLLYGFAAGFIVFFAVRGRKTVFLMNSENATSALNPFTSGFLGLIAGLFTDRVYELLMLVADALGAKIKAVVKEPNEGNDSKIVR